MEYHKDTNQIGSSVSCSFLGGAMEVGASCILLELSGFRILLDCGIRQKAGQDSLPDLRRIQEAGGIDAIVVSHAHMDHTGSLPVIASEYPLVPIYMTPMTADLARVLLYDSIKLMERNEDGIPLYAEKQVLQMLSQVHPVRFNEPNEILPGITLTLYPAGHIAGAACIYLQSRDGSVFYSGDFSAFPQNTIEGAMVPNLRPDVAIVESTYGDKLHANRQIEEDRLLDIVRECIEKKGKMLIPAFALGRAQEVLLILKRGMARKAIPHVRVWADGMVRQITQVYASYPEYLRSSLARQAQKGKDLFWTDDIQPVPLTAKREDLLNTSDPVIFVSSSGMLTGGPSVDYAAKIAPMENGYLVITGYQDEEAPGRQVTNLLEHPETEDRTLRLAGRSVPVKCHLSLVGLSAHGDRSEIQGLVQRLTPRDLFLVHGDAAVIETLGKSLEVDYRTRIYTPKDGEKVEVVLRSPRKQLKRTLPVTLQKTENLWEQDEAQRTALEKEFRAFLLDNYPERRFTLPELAFLWYGKLQDEETLTSFQAALQGSIYITRDPRRLFLYLPARDEDVAEAEKEQELTQQDIKDIAVEMFQNFPVRKIGLFMDRKEVSLTLDFPKPYLQDLQEKIRAYEERTGFHVTVPSRPNDQALQDLIREAFPGNVRKISINLSQSLVGVRVQEKIPEDEEKAFREKWDALTGYQISFFTEGEATALGSKVAGKGLDFRPGSRSAMEQNAAMQLIRESFAGVPAAPYKVGTASDSQGKFLKLTFLSPALGNREKERIQMLAKKTGWRLQVADAVNQNALMSMAVSEAKAAGITLLKNPSYLPGERSLEVQVPADTTEETFAAFSGAVEEKTGVPVRRKL